MEMVQIKHPDVEKPATVPARVLAHYEAVGWQRVVDTPPVPRTSRRRTPPPEPPSGSDTPIGDAAQAAAHAETEES